MTAAIRLEPDVPEFTIERRALAAALTHLRRALGRKPPPAHDLVLVEAQCGRVALTVIGTDIALQLLAPATVATPGTLVRPLGQLAELVRLGKGRVAVRGGRLFLDGVQLDLPTLDADAFPVRPAMPRTPVAHVPVHDLARALTRSAYAMSTDATRPHLLGALVEREGGALRVVATDGHRLAVATVESSGRDFAALVPRRGVECLGPVLAASNDEVHIHLGDDRVGFVTDTGWVSSALVTECTFPTWRQVVPRDYAAKATAQRRELLDAIRTLAPRPDDAVRFEFGAFPDRFVIRTDAGCAEILALLEGRLPKAVGFRASYLREMVVALDDDYGVTMEFAGELDPMKVIAPWGTVAVVMPMRL